MATPLRKPAAHASAATPPSHRGDDAAPAPVAAARWLKLPRADQRLRYAMHRWALALPSLIRGHRLQVDRAACYASRFEPRENLVTGLADLFDLRRGPGGVDYPILFAQSAVGLLQARILADLGVRGSHVRLLRHRTRLPDGVPTGLDAMVQDVDCRLARVVRVGPTEVVVLIETHIADARGHTLVQAEDVFVVRGLEVAYAVQAAEDDLLRRAVSRMRRREPEIDGATDSVRQRHLFVAPDVAVRHARVAGAQGLGLWQGRRSPVPPMVLRQLVSRELAEWGLEQAGLQITFTAKALPGQMLRLLVQGDAFELLDAQGRLLAFGKA